ncbi:hypothetical protein [Hymenobacter radiodurans]|nr:hypothetical protein [Hymenobacter radiodurans]
MMNDQMNERVKLQASRGIAALNGRPAALSMTGPAGKLPPRPVS